MLRSIALVSRWFRAGFALVSRWFRAVSRRLCAGFAQGSRRFRAISRGFAQFRAVSPMCYHMVSRGFARYRIAFAGYRASYFTVHTGYMRSGRRHGNIVTKRSSVAFLRGGPWRSRRSDRSEAETCWAHTPKLVCVRPAHLTMYTARRSGIALRRAKASIA